MSWAQRTGRGIGPGLRGRGVRSPSDAGGRLVVHNHDRLDSLPLVSHEDLLQALLVRAVAPGLRGRVGTGSIAIHPAYLGRADAGTLGTRAVLAACLLKDLHIEPQALRHVDPQMRELAIAEADDLVARRQSV